MPGDSVVIKMKTGDVITKEIVLNGLQTRRGNGFIIKLKAIIISDSRTTDQRKIFYQVHFDKLVIPCTLHICKGEGSVTKVLHVFHPAKSNELSRFLLRNKTCTAPESELENKPELFMIDNC
jgi:hypothetical protein